MRKLSIAFLALLLTALTALAQGGSTTPTLRIVTEDPTLPSELYYGNVKVKPLRLRPGTNTPITINDPDFFVQQQYIDFLSRMPEQGGFDAWKGVLQKCGDPIDAHYSVPSKCDRIAVSSSFYLSDEFKDKGYFVFRYYKALLGRLPEYTEMTADMRAVTGQTGDERVAKQAAYADAWVSRSEFTTAFPAGLSPTELVDKLSTAAGVTLANRAQLIADLTSGAKTRAQVVRAVVESPEVGAKFYNEGFVAMQYYGYLRRKPEQSGFDAWLKVINANPNESRIMIWGFLYSDEYKNRF